MKKFVSVFAVLLLLTACASEPPPPVSLETDNAGKINLDVLTVVVLDRSYVPDSNSPYTTNNFQPTIANALRRWATEKLQATGSTGEAIVVLRDASLKYAAIPHPDSWFTREQASKYVGRVQMDINVSRRNEHGQITVEASHFETLPEDSSPAERQNAYTRLLNALMREVSLKTRMGIRDHLGSYAATTPAN